MIFDVPIQNDHRGNARASGQITSNFQFRDIDAAKHVMVEMVSMVEMVIIVKMVILVKMKSWSSWSSWLPGGAVSPYMSKIRDKYYGNL